MKNIPVKIFLLLKWIQQYLITKDDNPEMLREVSITVENCNAIDWYDFHKNPPKYEDGEVQAYTYKWIDNKTNPFGTRVGFMDKDGKFTTALFIKDNGYISHQDIPTLWTYLPKF